MKDEPSKQASPSNLSAKDKRLYDLGEQLDLFIETGYYKKHKMFMFSFLQGIARGVGAVVGATIVIALVIWILSLFSQIPFLGNFTDKIQHSIEQSQEE